MGFTPRIHVDILAAILALETLLGTIHSDLVTMHNDLTNVHNDLVSLNSNLLNLNTKINAGINVHLI